MDTKQIKIIFFGTPSFVVPVLETLNECFSLVGVVTAPDQPAGRQYIITPSAVKSHTKSGPLFTPPKLDEEFIQQIKKLAPDLIVVASYGKIIPQSVLNIPKYGALNLHPSLLPKYRGASPIQAAVLNGDQVSGISIIKMDEKMDHGPVICQEEFKLSDKDTFESLSNSMFQRAGEIIANLIPEYIKGKIQIKEQNHTQASFCQLLKKEDGYFDITTPPSPEVLDRKIRAYYPWPNAWTKWNGKTIKFYPNQVVQMEGKKPTRLEDFLRGYPNFPIKTLS